MEAARVDHVIVLVTDLEAAKREFTSLGFTVTPRARHIHLGTANYLVVLDGLYIELLGMDEQADPHAKPLAPVAAGLAAGGGLSMVALTSPDADAFSEQLGRAGVQADPPHTWSRDADTPTGRLRASFTTFLIDSGAVPGMSFFFCRQHTPEAIWCPPWMHHANGARRVRGIVRSFPFDTQDAAARYARIAGPMQVHPLDQGLRVELGSMDLELHAQPQDKGVTLLLESDGKRLEHTLACAPSLRLVLEPGDR